MRLPVVDYRVFKSARSLHGRYPSGATVISNLSGMVESIVNSGCDDRNSCTAVFGLFPGAHGRSGYSSFAASAIESKTKQ